MILIINRPVIKINNMPNIIQNTIVGIVIIYPCFLIFMLVLILNVLLP